MRRATFVLAVLLGATCSARAADLVDAPTTPAPLQASAPVWVWSGPYSGVFVGYNFAKYDNGNGADYDGEDVIGGVYSGYNVQSGNVVYGVEGDIGYSGLDAGGFDSDLTKPVIADQNLFGSARARVGYAAGPALVFATGGLAVADGKLFAGSADDEKTHLGYTVGAGIEAKVTDNIAARLEYRYSDYEKRNYDLGQVSTSTGFDENSIRAGIALKF